MYAIIEVKIKGLEVEVGFLPEHVKRKEEKHFEVERAHIQTS